MSALRRAMAAVLLVLLAAAVTVAVTGLPGGSGAPSGSTLSGTVVSERGQGVEGARVAVGDTDEVRTDAQGHFSLQTAGRTGMLHVTADGHLPRTQLVDASLPADVPLTTSDRTLSLRFGGDVMFGRRYFDRDEDGDRSDAALPPGASVEDHTRLLRHVEPLLADADLTVVNLETPLLDEPYVDPTTARPSGFHPTKEFVFASAPESVRALLETGVDVVSLGNNHVLDGLGPGLERTLDALDRAGLPHFGAGRDADEAWRPAVLERKGQRVAYLGCTTITGTEHPIPYVAGPQRPGAARCAGDRLAREVRAARLAAQTVVVMIHGGKEYDPTQSEVVRRLTSTAEQAGAALVVNGHPHVVGGIQAQRETLIAETMGNLLFDQTVWPTFLSYLLRVDVRDGVPVVATVDPLLLEDEVPRPTTGVVAQAAARRAAGLLGGELRLEGPGAAWLPGRPEPRRRVPVTLRAHRVQRLPARTWADPTAVESGDLTLGEDLLWTGSFEDMDADPQTSGAHQWASGEHVRRSGRAACGPSGTGMELTRSPVSRDDVVLTPTHRQLVSSGTRLSLVADVRTASPGAVLELALFGDTRGASVTTLRAPVPDGEHGSGDCERVRLDAVVPAGIVAVQPYLRLAPAGDLQRAARLGVDDVLLVAWGPQGSAGRRYDVVESEDDVAALEVRSDAQG